MEGRGGCCIARYAGGSSYGYNVSNVDRIMLRFRPIAPKPTSAGSASQPESGAQSFAKTGRGKRKYTKKNGGCTNKKRKVSSSPEEKRSDGSTGSTGSWSGSIGEFESIVTLPLLPETPVDHVHVSNISDPFVPQNTEAAVTPAPRWLCFGEGRRRRKVETWVTVECVTETWVEGKELGSTDGERRMNLERDTCPGFGSDGVGRVRWTNEAYRKMVGQGEEGVDVMVWLAMQERVRVMLMYLPAFACRVRMQYRCGKEMMRSMTVPCDAWRLDNGGFAWRLDVKAALTL